MSDSSVKGTAKIQGNRRWWWSSNGWARKSTRLRRAEAACRRIARGRYENFIVASVLLPREIRQPFYNVYAFCRHADDLADLSPTPAEALRRLDQWQAELDRCFSGRPEHPILVALADTAERFSLSQAPFNDLLAAFRQDQHKTRYADQDELFAYCRRSANPVGRIVLRLAAAESPRQLAWSDSICTGLQLANHWQDLNCDRRIGRIYLPQNALAAAGLDDQALAEPSACPALRGVIAGQCQRARQLLVDGLPLADSVPGWLAADIKLFVHGGLATLDRIAAIDHDTLRYRPTVSRFRQLGLVARALLRRL